MRNYYSSEIRSVEPGDGWKLRVALICPTPYTVGIANLGMQLVYNSFNRLPGVACHRFYASKLALASKISAPEPKPKSLETNEPLSNYQLIAISLNYENDLFNLPQILDAAGIPFLAENRDDSFPLIIVGGVVATINPEPFSSLIDACVLGEAEEVIPEIVQALVQHWLPTRKKQTALEALSYIPGLYIPGHYRAQYDSQGLFSTLCHKYDSEKPALFKRFIPVLDTIPGNMVIHSPYSQFPDIHLLEISRGCKRNCLYCLVSNCYGSFRTRSPSNIENSLTRIPPNYRVGLLGAGSSEHPRLLNILEILANHKQRFSLSSIHVAGITKLLADYIHAYGPNTLTLAPETGLPDRRKKLGKPFSDESYIEAVRILAVPPVKRIKLYFMVGLPEESIVDLNALVNLCKRIQHSIKDVNRQSKTIPRLSAAIACYVPKASSAFERAPMEHEKTLKNKIKFLASQFRSVREIIVTFGSPRQSIIQGVLARGDRRLCDWLLQASKAGENWYSKLSSLSDPLKHNAFKPVSGRPLPWSHLQVPMYANDLNKPENK